MFVNKTLKKILKSPKALKIQIIAGAVIIGTLLGISLLADVVSPYSPTEFFPGYLEPPSATHLFGTDSLGRDVLSRIFFGSRNTFAIALLAVLTSAIAGTFLGSCSGYLGGVIDAMLSTLMDGLYSFPVILIALFFSILLSPGSLNMALAIAIGLIPMYFRVIRSHTISFKESVFIESEIDMGASNLYIIIHHLIPAAFPSIVVLITVSMGNAVLSVSGLGFLGLGIQPPTPEWGTDLGFSRRFITAGNWWTVVFPGIFIFLTVLASNQIAEGLNAVYAPRESSKTQ